MVAADLLAMVFFGWWAGFEVGPGQFALGLVVVVLGAAPAITILLVLWPLLIRGRLWVRLLEGAMIAALAFPIAPYYAAGLSKDLEAALQNPAPAVASSTEASRSRC